MFLTSVDLAVTLLVAIRRSSDLSKLSELFLFLVVISPLSSSDDILSSDLESDLRDFFFLSRSWVDSLERVMPSEEDILESFFSIFSPLAFFTTLCQGDASP